MLKIVEHPRELSFPLLMAVYREENRKNGVEDFPEEPELRQLELAEDGFRRYLWEVFFRTPGAFYALWEENGSYVSALRVEPYRDGLLLAGLETLPEKRGCGYGETLVEAVQHLPQVKKLYSHVEKSNAPSLALHKKRGFRLISQTATYIDGSVTSRAVTFVWEHP